MGDYNDRNALELAEKEACRLLDIDGTITALDEFDAERASQKLHKAMGGMLSTNEQVIIDVLTSHNNEQRQEIKRKYKTMYGSDLVEDLKSELGGHFEQVVLNLLMNPLEFVIHWLNKAMKGCGTDEDCLIDLLVGRDNLEVEYIKLFYESTYGKPLDKELKSELSGNFARFVRSLIAGGRDEEMTKIDVKKANADAKQLQDAIIGRADEGSFISIINTRSYKHLQEVFAQYTKMNGNVPVYHAINSKFSGDLKQGLMAAVKNVEDPAGYYAEKIKKAVKGAGTDDDTLIRILVGRSELDLERIKLRYGEMYKKTSLIRDVQGDTSGDYRKILVKILGASV